MKASKFNIYSIFEKTFNKKVFPFTSFGELKNSPKSTILQTEPREVLASNVVEFLKHKKGRKNENTN